MSDFGRMHLQCVWHLVHAYVLPSPSWKVLMEQVVKQSLSLRESDSIWQIIEKGDPNVGGGMQLVRDKDTSYIWKRPLMTPTFRGRYVLCYNVTPKPLPMPRTMTGQASGTTAMWSAIHNPFRYPFYKT
jgi:hypothetical protein